MPVTTPPTITPAPSPAPQRNDRTTFSTRVDAFVTWLIAVVAQFTALAANVYSNALEAYNSANSAAASKLSAEAAAAAAVNAAGASVFNPATNYAQYACAVSAIDYMAYRRKTAGVSALDPAQDLLNWVPLSITLADLHTSNFY